MLQNSSGRNVPSRGAGPIIQCRNPTCDGTLYQLQDGELLQKKARPGWKREIRNCECMKCGFRLKVPVQVRP